MNSKASIVLFCCFSIAIASVATVQPDADEKVDRVKRQLNFQPPPPDPNNKRFEVTRFEGGGSRGQGLDVNAAGKVRLWESNNGRNQIHGSGSYSQHLGGPYGNSRPNVGGGISFTHKFGK